MAESLSPARRARARRDFEAYNVFNSSSFILLSGSFLTLFALRLGASNAALGLLNALSYAAFFFMPLGKSLIRRAPIMQIFGRGWILRYLAMLPCLAAPLLVAAGLPGLAIALLLAGTAGFNIARGVGMIGNNPVLAQLAEGRDRGAFLGGVQLTASLAGLASNLVTSLVLGRSGGVLVYALAVGVGIVFGLIGTAFLLRLPEPAAYRPPAGSGLWKTTREAFREKPYRAFMGVFLLLSFMTGMARSFLPVYAKDAYSQGDDLVMGLSFIASLGAVAVGFLSRLALDRLGAKPLYAIYSAIAALGLGAAALSPALSSALPLLAGLFFLSSFGLSGQESAGQIYYFGLVPRERTLDLAVAYYVAQGIGGAAGATAGGFLLDGLRAFGLGPVPSFRAFYGVTVLGLAIAVLGMRRLVHLGSVSILESLGALFSLRDLRAFDLLTRLDQSVDPGEELLLIHELGQSGSSRSQRELLGYLSSPRFQLRMEALLALESLPSLSAASLAALAAEVRRRTSMTGYIAARILGKRGGEAEIGVLREALGSADPLLQGAAAVSLARLGDSQSIEAIEGLLGSGSHPRSRIQSAYALELFGSRASLPALVAALRSEDPPAFVSDELVLALASILGIMKSFYPLYDAFSEDEENGLSLLRLSAAERLAAPESRLDFERALASLFTAPVEGVDMARLILEAELEPDSAIVLADALLDPALGYRGFRFFAAAYYVFGRREGEASPRSPGGMALDGRGQGGSRPGR